MPAEELVLEIDGDAANEALATMRLEASTLTWRIARWSRGSRILNAYLDKRQVQTKAFSALAGDNVV